MRLICIIWQTSENADPQKWGLQPRCQLHAPLWAVIPPEQKQPLKMSFLNSGEIEQLHPHYFHAVAMQEP